MKCDTVGCPTGNPMRSIIVIFDQMRQKGEPFVGFGVNHITLDSGFDCANCSFSARGFPRCFGRDGIVPDTVCFKYFLNFYVPKFQTPIGDDVRWVRVKLGQNDFKCFRRANGAFSFNRLSKYLFSESINDKQYKAITAVYPSVLFILN